MAIALPDFARLPVLTVLLRHEMADGSSHVDWMIARDPDGCEPLVSFHLSGRLDAMASGAEVVGRRIGDHRPAYLDYEGPISDNRGRVLQLCRGRVTGVREAPGPDILRMTVVWVGAGGELAQELQLESVEAEEVKVRCIEVEALNVHPLASTGPRIKEET